MHPRSLWLLRDILAACDLLTERLAAHNAEEYAADPWLQGAAERQFEVIDEAIRRLERIDPETAFRIPGHRDIVDFRNVLAHEYADIDPAAFWDYARFDIPPQRAAVAAIVAQRLDLFGSASTDDFDPASSDLDFVATFNNSRAPGDADRYLCFVEALESLFQRPVDVVTERSIRSPRFRQAVDASRQKVHGERDSA